VLCFGARLKHWPGCPYLCCVCACVRAFVCPFLCCARACVCARGRVYACEHARVRVCSCVRVRVCMHACVCAWLRALAHAHVLACGCGCRHGHAHVSPLTRGGRTVGCTPYQYTTYAETMAYIDTHRPPCLRCAAARCNAARHAATRSISRCSAAHRVASRSTATQYVTLERAVQQRSTSRCIAQYNAFAAQRSESQPYMLKFRV
jgi:hypothetical protein